MPSLDSIISSLVGLNGPDLAALAVEEEPEELVVEKKTGRVRQAGTISDARAERKDSFAFEVKLAAEGSLYVFSKVIIGRKRLTPTLHLPVCNWFQKVPPVRKCLLLPRDCYKSSITSQSLPPHIHIQRKESNIYFPGKEGRSTRIMLACKTDARSKKHVRFVETQWEGNELLRALWPDCIWDKPSRDSKAWNAEGFILPRSEDYADLSMQATGVGAAITGAHFDVLIKDDLIDLQTANSPADMATAIEWHQASRALLDSLERGLEFTIGTRWAVHDLYSMIEKDPTVEVMVRRLVERDPETGEEHSIIPVDGTGKSLFPDSLIPQMKIEFGTLFPLIYQNEATDPDLIDFPPPYRTFSLQFDQLVFEEDMADVRANQKLNPSFAFPNLRGLPFNRETLDEATGNRFDYFSTRVMVG